VQVFVKPPQILARDRLLGRYEVRSIARLTCNLAPDFFGYAAMSVIVNTTACSCAQVQPVLQRLKTTLTGSGAALLMSSVLLFGLIRAGTDADGMYGKLPLVLPQGASATLLQSQSWLCIAKSKVKSSHSDTTAVVWNISDPVLLLLRDRPWRCQPTSAQREWHCILGNGARSLRLTGRR
jgi:hypothetical protein